jgi:hypothetical protein
MLEKLFKKVCEKPLKIVMKRVVKRCKRFDLKRFEKKI